ncbi:hypothetical protein VSQ82_08765 [Pseudomonas sp. MS-1(2024)]|nr:hypothetical protein [Pseudomonas sp. MS-1(2024)]MEC4167333.1 hypothetical protein [Pseudomonas sp. MS-1(2024)]
MSAPIETAGQPAMVDSLAKLLLIGSRAPAKISPGMPSGASDRELAEIRLQVFRGIQGLLGMFNRACYVNSTTRGADRG